MGVERRRRGWGKKNKIISSSSSNSNKSGKIFVHACTRVDDPEYYGYPGIIGKYDPGTYITYGKFFTIDLQSGQVLELTPVETTPPLFDAWGNATMLALGSTIYLLGGGDQSNKETNNEHAHKGASYLDLTEPKKGWIQAPITFDVEIPSCVSFDDKIYAFGSPYFQNFAQVFDPKINRWESFPLPRVDEQITVSYPAVADPSNNRILLHFLTLKKKKLEEGLTLKNMELDEGLVYAYYPADGTWECLVRGFNSWGRLPLLLDGVLYFHASEEEDMVCAYDLAEKKWLKVVLTSEFKRNLHLARYEAFLHLGDGVLGLVTFAHDDDSNSRGKTETFMTLVKFRVRRSPSNPQEILVTPLPVGTYYLNCVCQVVNALTL